MKKFLTWVSMGVFLFAGVYASITMARMPRTYDGAAAAPSVYELSRTPPAITTAMSTARQRPSCSRISTVPTP